jgi:hypothetical protein
MRIDDREARGDRNRRFHRIAAVLEHAKPGLRRPVVRRGHHAAQAPYFMLHRDFSESFIGLS